MSSFMLPVRRPAKPEPKKKEKDVEGGPGPSPPRGSPPTPFGLPLIAPVRAEMSRRFGEPFDDVRVHTGAEAAARAQSAGAAAYTLGRDVVFGAGRYAPETPDGRGLLTHELAHVVQQRRGAAAASAPPPGPALEHEARAAGAALGDDAAPLRVTGASAPALARQTPEEAEAAARERRQRHQATLNTATPELLAFLRKAGIEPENAPPAEIVWLGLPPSPGLQQAARDVGLPALEAARAHKPPPAFKPPPPAPTGDPTHDFQNRLNQSFAQAGLKPLPGTEAAADAPAPSTRSRSSKPPTSASRSAARCSAAPRSSSSSRAPASAVS